MRRLLFPAALAAAACSASPDPVAENQPAEAAPVAIPAPTASGEIVADAGAQPALAIDGEGLRLFDVKSGSARPLAFGAPRRQVLAALAFRGSPETGMLEECGAGPLDYASWGDRLTLYFQDGKFVGWAASDRGSGRVSTASGVGPGSTRAELQDAYSAKVFESTLGTEFEAGGLFGILESPQPAAKVTTMWGGTSCNMR
ncbi:MAG: hypothetical protein WKF52_04325 [Sphingomicrobium sp.]